MKPTATELKASFAYCRKVTRRASSTFYLASRMFAPGVRNDLCAIYAFCRIADDIADAPGLKQQDRRQELSLLTHTLKSERYSEGDELWPALLDTLARHKVPKTYFYELLEGMEQDIAPFEVKTYRDLERYSYLVAGTVGVMCVYVLGQPSQKALAAAKQLGIAMQITNILRDVSADAAIGRVYLPSDLLARHNLSRKQVLQAQNQAALAQVLKELAARAEQKYDLAAAGLPYLTPANRRPVQIALNLYRSILRRIEQKHYNVYNTRIRLSLVAKLMVVVRTR